MLPESELAYVHTLIPFAKPRTFSVISNDGTKRSLTRRRTDEDLRTPLPLKLTFANPNKILEMHERWVTNRLLEDRQAIEHGIEIGRGGVWLNLTAEQYAKLKKPR